MYTLALTMQLKNIKDVTFTLKYKHKLRHVYHNMLILVHIYILLKKGVQLQLNLNYLGEFDH